MVLANMVFQGTVLGPSLWNAFFADVALEIPIGSQEVNLFADDLSAMTVADQNTSENIVWEELREIQQRTHEWGRKNQVEFDPSKEFLVIVHPSRGIGDDFKLLGTLLDCKLTMVPCLEALLSKIRPKMRALLRLRHLYPVATMMSQYRCHVWGLKEYSTGILILAPPVLLRRIDKTQRWYLREFDVIDTDAFVTYNFAPPLTTPVDRHIGILVQPSPRDLSSRSVCCCALLSRNRGLITTTGPCTLSQKKCIITDACSIALYMRIF